MIAKIERDTGRFRRIIRGKIKKELKKYIVRGELIGRKGKDLVSIPLPQIDIPTFRYGHKGRAGVGQGEGEEGTTLAPGPVEHGEGAGEMPGDHILEVDITLEELAKLLGEELELPKIEPRGKKHISSQKEKYTGISYTGPESLRHFKRTYKEALKRQLISGSYNYKDPRIIPIREDKRYRSWTVTKDPESNAVIIYMMDVSGSMGDDEKEIVRIESFWIDTWLRSQYKGIETRYIIHDAVAREVDRETFYHTRESGGTKISSAYKLCNQMINKEYPPSDWNIYPFHFSDGDNWGGGDTKICIDVLEKEILPKANLFCYGQVESPYGSGEFKRELDHYFSEWEDLITSHIPDREGIYDSIKQFLGKGK
jgi:hypothetical protein